MLLRSPIPAVGDLCSRDGGITVEDIGLSGVDEPFASIPLT